MIHLETGSCPEQWEFISFLNYLIQYICEWKYPAVDAIIPAAFYKVLGVNISNWQKCHSNGQKNEVFSLDTILTIV